VVDASAAKSAGFSTRRVALNVHTAQLVCLRSEERVGSYRVAVVVAAVAIVSTLTAGRALAQGGRADLGSIAVKTVPPNALIYIDGERWVGPDADGRLVVQVPAGRHLVEVRAPGYRSYVMEADVRAGETTPVNVSLAAAAPPPEGPPVQGPPPRPVTGIKQVSTEGAESGFAFSPDYRFADVGRQTAHLLGGYGGVVFAGRLFVGAGGYWQLDYNHNNVNIAYGGGVFEWRQWNHRPVGLTLHALVGGGDAHFGNNYYYPGGPGYPTPYNPYYGYYYSPYHEAFFVFEPEAQVNVRLARDIRFSAGAGYRVTSTDYHGGVSGDTLNGWSGTISFRFGK
jgi:hypothetical protein